MQTQKVIGSESEGGVGAAAVIAQFHLENLRAENLDNGTHLSADQPRFGHVANQSDHAFQRNRRPCVSPIRKTRDTRNVSENFRRLFLHYLIMPWSARVGGGFTSIVSDFAGGRNFQTILSFNSSVCGWLKKSRACAEGNVESERGFPPHQVYLQSSHSLPELPTALRSDSCSAGFLFPNHKNFDFPGAIG